MDPDATLAELREAINQFTGCGGHKRAAHAAMDMARLAEALDMWMSGGGFLPEAWQVNRG